MTKKKQSNKLPLTPCLLILSWLLLPVHAFCAAQGAPTTDCNSAKTKETSAPKSQAEDIIAFASSIGSMKILPAQRIQLRNNSEARLELYVFNVRESSSWRLVSIAAGVDVEIPLDNVWLAVGTQIDKCKPLPDITTINANDLNSETSRQDGYFVRLLRERRRYELCLSPKSEWLVQEFREKLCN